MKCTLYKIIVMHLIRSWSRKHYWFARFIIAGLSVGLVLSVWIINGMLLLPETPQTLMVFGAVAVFLFIAVALLKRNWQRFSYWQKTGTHLLAGLAFYLLLFGFFASGSIQSYNGYSGLSGSFSNPKSNREKPIYENYTNKGQFYLDARAYYKTLSAKALKKELKKILKEQPDQNDKTNGEKALYLSLAIIAAIFALYGVAVLSCNLSCNGSDFAAAAVLVLGIGAIALLMILVIRRIFNVKRKKVKAEVKE